MFTPPKEIPPGVGIAHFGAIHLAWLGLIAIACVVLCRVWLKKDARYRARVYKGMAIALVGLEITKDLLYLFIGALSWERLPLHLCGICIFIMAIDAFRPSALSHQLVYSVLPLAGVVALLFPDWTALPWYHFSGIQSFLFHGLLILYAVFNLLDGRIRPDARYLPKCFLVLFAIALPVFFLNKALGTNFFFLNGAVEGTPLVLLVSLFGDPGYVLSLAVLLWVVWGLMYLPWYIGAKRKKAVRQKERG